MSHDAIAAQAGPAGSPDEPALRPGLHVVRRDDRHLQIGVDPPHLLVVADDPGTRRVLEDLLAGVPPVLDTPGAQRLVSDLHARGLLIDAATRDAALRRASDRAAAAATFAEFGGDAGRRLDARAGSRILVEAPADLAQAAGRLLRASGVGAAESVEHADVALVVCDDALQRARLDPLLRSGLPHLVVAPGPGGLAVGPFVVPGLTACLRCVDARLAERDPRRSMVLEQCGPDTRVRGPAPRDQALLALAVALGVRDLVSFVDGDRPATWSASITVGADLHLGRQAWRRHPHCGCSWNDVLAV